MSCCVPGPYAVDDTAGGVETDDKALLSLARKLGDGARQLEFAVPDAHCAACIRSIETALAALPQVELARVNLTKRRVRVVFDPDRGPPSAIAPAIRASGYHTYLIEADADDRGDPVLAELVRDMAVAGFAAGNIMLFSVSVWAGADAATRDLFHWISAAIALPAIAYAGMPFFRSAWRALRVGRTNMDVPISIGVLLATGLSIYETAISGAHAYFDASTTLLFFLLVGRTLDHLMRERARNAITNLARLAPAGAVRLLPDGSREHLPLGEVQPGMLLEVKAGERVPVDAALACAAGSFDYAIVSGESAPVTLGEGAEVLAGATNLAGPVTLRALRPSVDSFISRMAGMMEAAEGARTKRRRLTDRAAAVYAPIVHGVAAVTFVGWLVATSDWHAALLNAVAVLIITCPCALALAVPIVHVVAAGKLFARGILMKDGAALERAAEVRSVAFDKTGTLTLGTPALIARWGTLSEALDMAATMARASSHPLSRALAAELGERHAVADRLIESPGNGVEAITASGRWRLGNATWCGVADTEGVPGTQVWLTRDGQPLCWFCFADPIRPDAAATVAALERMGLPVTLLSGDHADAVEVVAAQAGIATRRSQMTPEDKVAALAGMDNVLMVGDGINDAPALRAALVSMAPASATDIGRSAADFVFTGGELSAVPYVVEVARRASALVNQNIALAIGYNAVAVPLAVCGLVTPLVAAVAMSLSSIVVVLNAMRLRWDRGGQPWRVVRLPRMRAASRART